MAEPTRPELEPLEDRLAAFVLFGPWPTHDLTYSLVGDVDDVRRRAITDAFREWASVAPLHFVETEDSGPLDRSEYSPLGHAQIRVHFGQTFGGFVVGQAIFPGTSGLSGDVFLSDVLLPAVALHEVGHAIGLDHSDVPGSVMSLMISSPDARLRPDDVAGVQALYGVGVGSVTPLVEPPPVPLPPVPPFTPYLPFPGYSGQVLRALADVDGDGTRDNVFVPAVGGEGHLKGESADREVFSVLAFPGFLGEVRVSGGGALGVAALLPDGAVHFKCYVGGVESVSLLVGR